MFFMRDFEKKLLDLLHKIHRDNEFAPVAYMLKNSFGIPASVLWSILIF